MKTRIAAMMLAAGLSAATAARAAVKVERSDHFLAVTSTAPSLSGKFVEIYVREVKAAGAAPSKGVVLFVHGAGTPAEVAFDSPYKDYSWMAYLAAAGFDTFAMDLEGYGRSQRPPQMADACYLSAEAQNLMLRRPLKAACAPPSTRPLTTMSSDWNDISAVVNYLLSSKGVKQVALVGWSQGGPRTVGYTLANPEKVSRLVVLAPAYDRSMPGAEPSPLPAVAAPLTSQSQPEFKANWDRQAPCPGQYEPQMLSATWSDMIKSDSVGAGWGPGVRRAPSVPSWGFNKDTVAGLKTPFLMVAGVHDKQVDPERVRQLYEDAGSSEKVLIDLACSSHNAMWEKNHLLLFKASLDWLTEGKVGGASTGMAKLGD